ncbi:MAG: hypothetical protein CL910_19660 [Deltaproteobacteria bacterium]|nr:hypothetical protein [Deltaproteobacteria bacterium]
MRVVEGSEALGAPLPGSVVTVGNFDGLHVGHRAIMDTVTSRAAALAAPAVVYTFEPHPRKVLYPDRAPQLLTTLDQKLELLEARGVDIAIVEPFTREFARLPAEDFVRRILYERIRPSEVYVGYDFHYGRDREGSMRTLTELGPHLGFAVTIIPEVMVGDRDVNSTRIRQLLEEGRVTEAALLLDRPYTVRGAVAKGDQRGQTIGFPTLNLAAENEILPARGVYAGHVRFLDEGDPARDSLWPAVTNVGKRPTFKEDDPVLAEAHLLGFEGPAYGRRIEIAFEHFLREEKRFPDVEALTAQIGRDAVRAREVLAEG